MVKTDPAQALAELEVQLAKIDGIDDALKANILKRAENKSEFLKSIRSMNMATVQLVPGSKQLIDLAVYAVKNGITRVEDFFNILKQNGLKKSLGDLTGDEVKALREALEDAVQFERVQANNVQLVARLKELHPEMGNREIADLAKADLDVPTIPLALQKRVLERHRI